VNDACAAQAVTSAAVVEKAVKAGRDEFHS